MNKKLVIYIDGAARGNPGPAGVGVLGKNDKGDVILEEAEYLGEKTNNEAEYTGLLIALKRAKEVGANDLEVFSDSELLVKQISGVYRVKNDRLKKLYIQAMTDIKSFNTFEITHVERALNKAADALANQAIDEYELGLKEVYRHDDPKDKLTLF